MSSGGKTKNSTPAETVKNSTWIACLELFQIFVCRGTQGEPLLVFINQRRTRDGEQLKGQPPGNQRQNTKRDISHCDGVKHGRCQVFARTPAPKTPTTSSNSKLALHLRLFLHTLQNTRSYATQITARKRKPAARSIQRYCRCAGGATGALSRFVTVARDRTNSRLFLTGQELVCLPQTACSRWSWLAFAWPW